MSEKADDSKQGEEKLEDILRSIRNIIDDRDNSEIKPSKSPKIQDSSDSILELTDIVSEEDSLVSSEAFNRSSAAIMNFSRKLDTHSYKSDNGLDGIITDLMKPLLKDWMDNNLPKLVEKVVSDEIKKLVPKR